MNEHEIVKALSQTGKSRAKLYLNVDRIDEIYTQQVSAISELARGSSVDVGASASLASLFGAEMSSARELEASITLTPVLKAILIEYQSRKAKQLVDVSNARAMPGALLIHTGASQIIDWYDDVSSDTADLPVETAKIIQGERTKQQRILSHRDNSIKTIVWLATSEYAVYASVASSRWIDEGALASYGRSPLGFLGHYESQKGTVTFLSPLWIWHDW